MGPDCIHVLYRNYIRHILFFVVLYPTAAKNKAGFVADNSLPTLTVAARQANRDYVIETATMFVNLDAQGSQPGKIRAVDVRIVYTVFALNEVKEFDEGYHSMQANVNIHRIRGSDPETALAESAPAHKSWLVNTSISPGSRRTIVTGARYVYTLPLPSTRSVHDYHNLGPLDDAWCYPNESDIIGEFTLIIQSRYPIRPPQDGDMLMMDRSDPKQESRRPETPSLHAPDVRGAGPYVLVAKWGKVLPRQSVQVRFSRDEADITPVQSSPETPPTVHNKH